VNARRFDLCKIAAMLPRTQRTEISVDQHDKRPRENLVKYSTSFPLRQST